MYIYTGKAQDQKIKTQMHFFLIEKYYQINFIFMCKNNKLMYLMIQ